MNKRVFKKNKTNTLKFNKKKNYPKKQQKKVKKVKTSFSSETPSEITPPKKKTRKKTSSDKMYFTKDTESAIELYNCTNCDIKRNEIYETKIKFSFEKLVENIFNTFKFVYFETSPLDVQKEVVSHLAANMHKFNSEKGKAFSYFSIVAKHYLIFLNNSNYKRFNQSVEIGEEKEEHTVQLQSEDKHYQQKELSEFMKLMVGYWEQNIGKIFTKQKDLNIANAVIELFRNSDRIDAFNKKALYLYIREISNCKTQQITKIINRMKQFYVGLVKSYKTYGTISNVMV
jgi:hypothetical protein